MSSAADTDEAGRLLARPAAKSAYRWYVLFILMLVYALNYVDRQIITILAVHIKADLGISDAQFGLLFGTAFAVFYGLFGIPMARLSDGWGRVKVPSASLGFRSMMTAFSGFSTSFAQLGGARIGVGVGEAGATPAGVSLLGDYFERGIRATVLSIYSVTSTSGRAATVFALCYGMAAFFLPMWFAPLQAATQDLVPPKLRGLVFAVFSIGPNVLGLGLGPYATGLLSDAPGDLRIALLAAIALGVLAVPCLLLAARKLANDEGRTIRHMEGSAISETA